MDQETFINQILNSTNNISRIEPDKGLYAKIGQRIQERKTVPVKVLWLAAASIVVLLTLNIAAFSTNLKSEKKSAGALENVLNKSNQLY